MVAYDPSGAGRTTSFNVLGFGLGIVTTNAVTTLPVVAGLPVTLTGTVTPPVARLLATFAGVSIHLASSALPPGEE